LPILYLRGVSTGDFQEALAALLGKDAPPFTAWAVLPPVNPADCEQWGLDSLEISAIAEGAPQRDHRCAALLAHALL
jgi:hypothetical protein